MNNAVSVVDNKILFNNKDFTNVTRYVCPVSVNYVVRELANIRVLKKNGGFDVKKEYVKFAETFKTKPSTVVRIINSLIWKNYYYGVPEKLRPTTIVHRGKKVFIDTSVVDFLRSDIGLQIVNDEHCSNIAPICIHFKKSTTECKTVFGKGLWKVLCKNSFRKNLLLCRTGQLLDINTSKKYTKDIPSVFLEKLGCVTDRNIDFFNWWKLHCYKKHKLNKREMKLLHEYYYDSLEMNRITDSNYNINCLSLEELKQVHIELINKHRLLKVKTVKTFSNSNMIGNFEYLDNVANIEWKVKQVPTNIELLNEGADMKHCVGSYTRKCEIGNYIVLSIMAYKDDILVSRSTMGIEKNKNNWSIEQHYGKGNSPVKLFNTELENIILKKLNH